MSLADARAKRDLTLEQLAVLLGLSPKSRGWLSEIERGVTDASIRLALRIEEWSDGEVPAWSVNSELAGHRERSSAKADAQLVAPDADHGAEKSLAVFSPAEDAA